MTKTKHALVNLDYQLRRTDLKKSFKYVCDKLHITTYISDINNSSLLNSMI